MSPPFPTVPVTVDLIIELGGDRIVLIERRDNPHGWALPGGFVEPGESVAEAAIREAKEETGLDVTLVDQFWTYSKPGRDTRGPVASVCFIARADGIPVGGDDAKNAGIFSTNAPMPLLAFDHADIIKDYRDWRQYRVRPNVIR